MQATVPGDWHQTNVAPAYEKGEKYDPANYRPVSLTCICCKTYIPASKIMQHLSEHDILHGQRYINITRNAIGPKSGQKDCRKF